MTFCHQNAFLTINFYVNEELSIAKTSVLNVLGVNGGAMAAQVTSWTKGIEGTTQQINALPSASPPAMLLQGESSK